MVTKIQHDFDANQKLKASTVAAKQEHDTKYVGKLPPYMVRLKKD